MKHLITTAALACLVAAPALAQTRASAQFEAMTTALDAYGFEPAETIAQLRDCRGATGQLGLLCAELRDVVTTYCSEEVGGMAVLAAAPEADFAPERDAYVARAGADATVLLVDAMRADRQAHPGEGLYDYVDTWQRACRAVMGLPL